MNLFKKPKSSVSRKKLKTKILFLTLYEYGLRTYTNEIVSRLRKKGFNVKVEAWNARFPLITPIIFHIRNVFRTYWHYDIIISNDSSAPYLFSYRKIEIFHHSYYEILKKKGFSIRCLITSSLQYISLLGSNRIIVPSFATKATISQKIDRKKIHVIPHGIKVSKIQKRSLKELSDIIGKEKTIDDIVLSVGRYDINKGHELTLKAFLMSFIQSTLIFAGFTDPGFIAATISQYPHLKERVITLGKVSDDLLEKLYAAAKIYIALPIVEGFGFTFLEAMARGIPVIGPRLSPITEVVGDSGILVNSISDAAKALRKLDIDKEYRKELISLGKIRASKFNWDNSVAKLIAVIQEIISIY